MIIYKKLKKYFISDECTIYQLIDKVNLNGKKFAILINDKEVVSGIFTDGDLRRLLSRKIDLNKKIKTFSKKNFVYISENSLKHKKTKLNKFTEQLPIVDKDKKLKGILLKTENHNKKLKNTVFILAGGFGKRMGKITKKTPKPMLKINKKPILENIILSFKEKGLENFLISTNHLASKISDYFGDGSLFNVNIGYVKELFSLGTAGSLSLINKKKIADDIIVTNGDLYGNLDYANMLNIHKKKLNDITVCARLHTYDLPYGLITDKNEDNFLNEKPKLSYLINSGIYVVKKKLLKHVKKNTYLDMNNFLNFLKKKKYRIGVYTIYEPIHDIGNLKQYNLAKKLILK